MAYVIFSDFKKLIQTDNLKDIIGNDMAILTGIAAAAVTKAVSYLVQKYDCSREFAGMVVYDQTVIYKALDRIYLDAPAFDAAATYTGNELVLQTGTVYRKTRPGSITGPFDVTQWEVLGLQYAMFYGKLPSAEFNYLNNYTRGTVVFYLNKQYTASQDIYNITAAMFPDKAPLLWGAGTAYTIAAGTLPTDDTKWVAGDSRNPDLLNTVIDIALYTVHSRISPRNIPDLRVKRYDDAVKWLKEAAQGTYVTADLPKIQPLQGKRIRYGGQPKQPNTY